MMGSVTAINASGTRQACQSGSRAPAKTLVAPTGAKFGGCGSSRATAPNTVSDRAAGRQFDVSAERGVGGISLIINRTGATRKWAGGGNAELERPIRAYRILTGAGQLWGGRRRPGGRLRTRGPARGVRPTWPLAYKTLLPWID